MQELEDKSDSESFEDDKQKILDVKKKMQAELDAQKVVSQEKQMKLM